MSILAVLHDNVQVVLEVVADHLVDTNNVVVANLLHGSDLITHIFIHEAVGSKHEHVLLFHEGLLLCLPS